MSEKQQFIVSEDDQQTYNGVVFSITDGDSPELPIEKALHTSSIYDWFQVYPEDISAPILKILTYQAKENAYKNGFDIPYSKKVIDEALWGSQVYTDWSRMHSGGCAGLLDSPVRLTLQTPIDGYPFISLALSKKGHICKGIYTYDHPDFDPIQMMSGERLYSGWRGDGLQIISIPQAFLRVHSQWLSKTITSTLQRLQNVEDMLSSPYIPDFAALQRTLYACQDTILNLERRSEFESLVVAAIESVVSQLGYSKRGPWAPLAPAKAAIQLRKAELENIPRRIASARVAINDNILQRTQLQSLMIAQSTQRIAEATMNDSASMKTIAILTMIFLPGTAVASFFSMTMWNWNADGSDLVSPWLWIYFAVATPLTVGVIGFWYFWMLIRTKRARSYLPTIATLAPPYDKSD